MIGVNMQLCFRDQATARDEVIRHLLRSLKA
jgi:hypothetical protein